MSRNAWAILAFLSAFAFVGAAGCSCDETTAEGETDAGGGDGAVGHDGAVSGDGGDKPDGSPTDGGSADGAADGGGDAEADGGGDGETPDGGVVLRIDSIAPASGWRGTDIAFTLVGDGFQTGATVTFANTLSEPPHTANAANVVVSDAKTAQGTLPADIARPLGLYDVTVTNPDSNTATLEDAFAVLANPPPEIADVAPKTGWTGDAADGVLSDPIVNVTGQNFVSTPAVRFILAANQSTYFFSPSVAFVSPTSVTAVAPTESYGMPAGDYIVELINPDKQSDAWETFTVTGTPAPRIDSIDPIRAPSNTGADPLKITGDYFTADSKAAAVTQTGDIDLPTTFVSAQEINAVIGGGVLQIGFYPIKVTNADGQYDVYYAYQSTPSSEGKLTAWTPMPFDLAIPRWKHAGVVMRDEFNNPYVFIAGGNDGTALLDSVEHAPVDFYGGLGGWKPPMQFDAATGWRIENRLKTARQTFALARYKGWVYAVGGANANGALNSVERAFILTSKGAPQMERPSYTMLAGSLPKGTWYYKVSAVSADGESLPGQEAILGGVEGTAIVKWLSVPGAASYNVYRSVSADGISGSERLLAWNVPGTTFNDDGEGALTPAPAFLRAASRDTANATLAEGLWRYRVSAVTAAGETLASYPMDAEVAAGGNSVLVLWDAVIGAASYNVYRTAAVDATGGGEFLLASGVAVPEFTDDGSAAVDPGKPAPLGISPLERGSISLWKPLDATPLNEAREGVGAIYVQSPDDKPFLYAVGGRSSTAAYFDSVEKTAIDPDTGDLLGWAYDTTMNVPKAFHALVTNQGRNEIEIPQGGGGQPPITFDCDNGPHIVAVIEVTPVYAQTGVGGHVGYTALAKDASGCIMKGLPMTWTSSDVAVATIDAAGVATGMAKGTTFITASYGGVTSNKAQFDVVDQPVTGVMRIEVTPASATKAVGETQQFVATAYDAQNAVIPNVTFAWKSSSVAVAPVNATGLATAVAAGTTGITASAGGVSSNTALLTVTGGPSCGVAFITIGPNAAGTPVGGKVQFAAHAYGGMFQEIQGIAFSWYSTNPNVATIDSTGLATGVAVGTTNVFATACGVESNRAVLTVSSSGQCALSSIRVRPENATIHVNQTQEFTAAVYDSCGNMLNGVSFAWASSKTAVASVADGLASGLTPGVTEITAASGAVTSNKAVLTVLLQEGADETPYIYAIAGDDAYTPSNDGVQSIVYATVGADGVLSAWKFAAEETTKRLMGLQALLYFDFLFTFGGAQKEDAGGVTASNTVERFAWRLSDGDLTDKQNTGAQMKTSRSFFALVRINPYIYAIGGNSGGMTLVATTERIPQ
ncbi:MAG: Ig-like domain-containing protein [Deltaproteobacteria bacterium]|nr:Ig-like domain-containing protein [Deltaproteobacteria bacterium]